MWGNRIDRTGIRRFPLYGKNRNKTKRSESPWDILDQRFAKDEISKEEYEEQK